MKTYRQIIRPARADTVVDSLRCDICHRKAEGDNWTKDMYDAAETVVRWKAGTSFPEGGSGATTEIDICPECFETKLIPWVESQGGKPEKKEWDTL